MRDTLAPALVTALGPRPEWEGAHTVQRIGRTDLTLRGITDAADALRRLSGVNLRDYGGAGGLKTVSVRGLGASHTALSYDGLTVSDAQTGQADLSRYRLERIGQIELQNLDALSLLCPVRHLAAAMVSLTPAEPDADSARWHGEATVSTGSFGMWGADAALRRALTPRTRLSAGGNYYFARNDYPFTLANGVATEQRRRANSRMQAATAEAGVCHTLRGGELSGRAYFYHAYRRLPGMVRYYVNENHERQTDQNAFAQLRYSQHWQRLSLMAAAKYNRINSLYDNYDAQYANAHLSRHYRTRELYATAGAACALLPALSVAYATDYAREWMTGNAPTDRRVQRDTWLHSLSLRYERAGWQLTARAVCHLAWNSRRGGTSADDARRLCPSLTVARRLRADRLSLTLRAGYKESFRLPTFSETYYYHLGTPTLHPELARQLTLGTSLHAAPAPWMPLLALSADVYANRVADRILAVPYTANVWRMQNLGRVDTFGADLALNVQVRPASGHLLDLAANYTLQRSENRTSPTEQEYGKQLPYVPRHSGALSAAWQNPWLSLSLHTTCASLRWASTGHLPTTSLPAYAEWGLALYRTFRLRRAQLLVRADLINASDRRYEVIRYYPMPGRSWKCTLKYSF